MMNSNKLVEIHLEVAIHSEVAIHLAVEMVNQQRKFSVISLSSSTWEAWEEEKEYKKDKISS